MANEPTAQDVYDFLDGYGVKADVVKPIWITNRITNFIKPKVKSWTRQTFDGVEQIVEYHSGTGENLLILNRRPIVDLISIELVQSSVIDWNINLSNIEVIQDEGILKAKNLVEDITLDNLVFPRGTNNLKVTFTYGYAQLPEDIKEAILYLTADQVLMILASRTGGGGTGNRSYGNRGRYTEIRNDLARQAYSLLKTHMTGVVGQ